MSITLAFTSEKDLEGTPVLFLIAGFLPVGQPTFPAPSRTFHAVADLLDALEPAQINQNDLWQLAESLERGRAFALDVSTDQAKSIGMLPNQERASAEEQRDERGP
jgi:hypothetical protein